MKKIRTQGETTRTQSHFPLLFLSFCLCSCAAPEKKLSENEPGRVPSSVPRDSTASIKEGDKVHDDEVRELLTQLGKRMDTLEMQVASVNDKLDLSRAILDRVSGAQKAKTTEVVAHPSEMAGTNPSTPLSAHDPDSGFVNDEPIQSFRKAMILFQAQKYSESILAFSTFLEKYPDHPIAGSAQFYIAESYLKQGELKLAVQEFQRVLTSYDRSEHIAETLSEMAQAEDTLKKSQSAANHRQLLSSLFPGSPPMAMSPSTEMLGTPTGSEPDPANQDSPTRTAISDTPPTAPAETQ